MNEKIAFYRREISDSITVNGCLRLKELKYKLKLEESKLKGGSLYSEYFTKNELLNYNKIYSEL